MVLIISHKGFHPGFELFELGNSIRLEDKNEWQKYSLYKKIKITSHYKMIHYFWGRVNFWEMLVFLLLRRKIFLHFIGSDVLMVLNSKSKQIKTKFYKWFGTKLLVVHNNLKHELKEVGIQTEVVEFVNRKIENINPIVPKEFSVLVYCPEGKEEFYNLKTIEDTAKVFPEIKFYVFPYNSEIQGNNIFAVKYLEHKKIIDLINQHKLFVRIPKHDGLPNTIIEALMCARYVVWSLEHPFAYKANNVKELSDVIKNVKEKSKLNEEGKKYVLQNYNSGKMKKKFLELWQLN